MLLILLIWIGRIACFFGSLLVTALLAHWLLGPGYLSIGIALAFWAALWAVLVKVTRVGFAG
jgi:hypothetical protein